jgi:hypothetical protein
MVEVSALAKKATTAVLPLLRSGLTSLVKWLVLGQLLTFVAMVVAGYVGSRHGEWSARITSAFFVGLVGTIATVVISSHRAVFAVIEAALEKLAMGSALFQVLFAHLLGVSEAMAPGERLGVVGNALETRVPLAQACQRLNNAVLGITREKHGVTGLRGWLLTQVRTTLLERVANVTLARFRREDQSQGAIDLIRVRDELGEGLDTLLIDQVHGISTRTTWLFGGFAVAIASLTIFLIHWYW